MNKELPKDLRQNMLAKLHIARKQLGLEEEEYRSLLETVTGKRSAAELNTSEFVRVMERFVQMGFRVDGRKKPSSQTSPKSGRGKKPTQKLSPQTRDKPELEKTQVDKIRALWIDGYHAGVIRNRYESGLNGFVRKRFKCDRVEWLTWEQAQKCIEAIKSMIDRGKKDE